MEALYAVNYTEYERGWGQRPDGSSIHKSKTAAEKFKADIEKLGDPEIFVRGSEPFLVEATPTMIEKIGDEDSCWFHFSNWLK